MLISMTGYGEATATRDGVTARAEMRSVNNRYFEFSARLPRSIQVRENEVKELVRKKLHRGKVTLNVSVEKVGRTPSTPVVNVQAARACYTVLASLRDAVGASGDITLDMILRFPEVLVVEEPDTLDSAEWETVIEAVTAATDMLAGMREREGAELAKDLVARIDTMETELACIEEMSRGRRDVERARLRERVEELLRPGEIDPQRLELEIVLLADKLDVTEEITRFRSHVHFFRSALDSADSEGRKLGFLVQEMNREANTIGSKAYDADIAHRVVIIKEELERIREQLQNVE
ncbi:MAG: YicC family protein [Bacteroidota bacterium]|nr:YicC family protein [Bacteroidota bacterium]